MSKETFCGVALTSGRLVLLEGASFVDEVSGSAALDLPGALKGVLNCERTFLLAIRPPICIDDETSNSS